MVTGIIISIIIGAIIGGLARLVMPGHQNISVVMTIILGILGSAIGNWLVSTLFHYNNNNGGIPWIGIIAGVVIAAILISIYMSVVGGRSRV